MVDRGHCKFTQKANAAQAAGASAVLIINNQKGDHMLFLLIDAIGKLVVIPKTC